ncbi:hypothetical protein SDC9_180354 [bioreactor metagenome]|uniref:Uncharacterized protein n=1 Tax=bioreactor metagenome TaxID=1076179 RepID=A0A645H1I6_9ZZZZ
MFLIIVPKAQKAHENQLGGVDADGAVGGVHDGLGRHLDAVNGADIRFSVQNASQHIG